MKSFFPYRLAAGLLAAALPCTFAPQTVEAAYEADDDAGVNRLDFIENRHRTERENQPTAAMTQAVEEATEMQQHLRYPIDPAKAAPATFTGDELTYDQVTGEFTAKGHVHIVQADAHTFTTEDSVSGNLQKEEVTLPGHAKVVQMTPGQAKVDLDGYHAFYRYGAKEGTMEAAKGKVDHQYVTGKRFEFYPDHIVIHDGTATKCSAAHPDYLVKAATIEYWPDKLTVYHDAKFLIKGNVIAKKHLHIVRAGEEDKNRDLIPRAGYDKNDGVWLREKFHRPVADRVEAHFEGKLMTKNDRGMRSHADLVWSSVGAGAYRLSYGYFQDGNENWIKRKPEFGWEYGHDIAGTPWSYRLGYSIGRWQSQKTSVESNHQVYSLGLYRAPWTFPGRWYVTLAGGYRVTRESYDDSIIRGTWGDAAVIHEFDDTWAAYLAYAFNKETSRNSVFDFDLDDYNKKFQAGLSFRATPRDRFVAACEWDAQHDEMHDVDYYWYHDMHCAQLILRYRSKQDTWKVQYQFTPW